jgi:tetratricopeptide (TPR) repeat protein
MVGQISEIEIMSDTLTTSELWNRLRDSPRNQALIVLVLVFVALALGTVIEKYPSESLLKEREFFRSDNKTNFDRCPGPRGSAANMACVSTINLKLAYDNETRSQQLGFRAKAYTHMRRDDLALRDLDQALALKGVTGETLRFNLMLRGGIELTTHDASGAEADFTRAIALLPQDERWSGYYGRGLARIGLGKPTPALSDFNAAITALLKLNAQLPLIVSRDEMLFSKAERQELEARWKLSFARTIARCYASRATAYRAIGQYSKSIDDYDAAIKLTPGDASLYSGRARTEFAMGNWQAGFGDFWTRTKLVFGWK